MTTSFDHLLVQAYQGRPLEDLLRASPAALSGLSDADASRLQDAFGTATVRELAENRFFQRAVALLAAAGRPGFDPGPPLDWSEFFDAAPLSHYEQHPAHRFRIDFGPVYYRGRLDGSARVIVVGQDPSHDEILGHRVFVGRSGQRVQGLLARLGLVRSYTMLNTFLYSVFGQFDSELERISLEPTIDGYRQRFLDSLAAQNRIQAVIAVGNAARHALEAWPGNSVFPVVHILHPAARDDARVVESWNAGLDQLRPLVDADDGATPDPRPYEGAIGADDEVPIPRHDLPFGMPAFHGVGSRSERDGNQRIIWIAPGEP